MARRSSYDGQWNWLGLIAVAIGIAAFVGLLWWANNWQHDDFMQSCLPLHSEAECQMLWKLKK